MENTEDKAIFIYFTMINIYIYIYIIVAVKPCMCKFNFFSENTNKMTNKLRH